MHNKKIFLNGWIGPWCWTRDIIAAVNVDCKYKASENSILFVDTPDNADIIWQADTTNWQLVEKYLGKKFAIANVLDFAEWTVDNTETLKYIHGFVSKANLITGISQKVIDQIDTILRRSAKLFYYPSQVCYNDTQCHTLFEEKAKIITTFCRLSDPGKAIPFAVESFINSDIHKIGWKYMLVGPEPLPKNTPKHPAVLYAGYLDKHQLIELIKRSKFVLQPSYGEGLGLPSIEAALLGTIPIVRDIKPVNEVWQTVPELWFNNDKQLKDVLVSTTKLDAINYQYYSTKCNSIAQPWLRDNAFRSAIEMLEDIKL